MNRLVRFGAEALKPQKVAGVHKWRTPKVSRRKANVLRKKALRDGSYGSVVVDAGDDGCWGRRTGTREMSFHGLSQLRSVVVNGLVVFLLRDSRVCRTIRNAAADACHLRTPGRSLETQSAHFVKTCRRKHKGAVQLRLCDWLEHSTTAILCCSVNELDTRYHPPRGWTVVRLVSFSQVTTTKIYLWQRCDQVVVAKALCSFSSIIAPYIC